MTTLRPVQIAIAGEALIDLIARPDGAFEPCLGGAVYNLSRALSLQGMGTLYLNPFSKDRFGQALRQQIMDDGVLLHQATPIPAPTSLAVVALDPSGHPDYAFYRDGVADRQVNTAQFNQACDPSQVPDLRWVCTGGLALDPQDEAIYLPWLRTQRQAGRLIAVDANLRPSVMPDLVAYRRHVLTLLNEAHLIKVSDEDLQHLHIEGATPLAQAQHLLNQTNAQLLALTLGAAGAYLLSHNGATWFAQERQALQVVDTVGAGDSFFAGLLAALTLTGFDGEHTLSEENGEHALRHALASASLCVQARGCVPPNYQASHAWASQHPALTRFENSGKS
jgi:fructokinase